MLCEGRRNARGGVGAAVFGLLIGLFCLHLTGPAAAAEAVMRTCDGCHSRAGSSLIDSLPTLDGLSEDYLRRSLEAYRDGRRPHYLMGMLARGLQRDEIARIAALYAARPYVAAGRAGDALRAARAEARAGVCRDCHGADFEGAARGPRLAGQPIDYLITAMAAYRDGERKVEAEVMTSVLGLDNAALGDLAHLIALSGRR